MKRKDERREENVEKITAQRKIEIVVRDAKQHEDHKHHENREKVGLETSKILNLI